MITRIQQDMEDNMYKTLKDGGFDAKSIVTEYNKQTIEELASEFTEGMMMSRVGIIIKNLPPLPGHEDFKAMCRGAFKEAILRLLKEASV